MNRENTDHRAAWEAYASIWKLEGAAAKKAACARALDPDCIYRDPLMQCRGFDELVDYMVKFHQQVPGGHFVTTKFEVHHGRSLAHWNLVAGHGTVLDTGVSYGEYGADGRPTVMTGFFEVREPA